MTWVPGDVFSFPAQGGPHPVPSTNRQDSRRSPRHSLTSRPRPFVRPQRKGSPQRSTCPLAPFPASEWLTRAGEGVPGRLSLSASFPGGQRLEVAAEVARAELCWPGCGVGGGSCLTLGPRTHCPPCGLLAQLFRGCVSDSGICPGLRSSFRKQLAASSTKGQKQKLQGAAQRAREQRAPQRRRERLGG